MLNQEEVKKLNRVKQFALVLVGIKTLEICSRGYKLYQAVTGGSKLPAGVEMNMEAQTTPFAIWMNVMAILALVIFIFLYWHNYQLAKEEELPEKFVFEADVIYILLMTLTDFLIARRSMPGAPLPIVLGGTAVGVVVGLAILAFPYFTLRQLKKAHKEMDEEKSIFQKKYWQQLTQKVRRGR